MADLSSYPEKSHCSVQVFQPIQLAVEINQRHPHVPIW